MNRGGLLLNEKRLSLSLGTVFTNWFFALVAPKDLTNQSSS